MAPLHRRNLIIWLAKGMLYPLWSAEIPTVENLLGENDVMATQLILPQHAELTTLLRIKDSKKSSKEEKYCMSNHKV